MSLLGGRIVGLVFGKKEGKEKLVLIVFYFFYFRNSFRFWRVGIEIRKILFFVLLIWLEL